MKMPSQLVVFTLLVVGCGGRAVDACDLSLSVETYEVDAETQARRPLSESAGCFEPNSDARVEPFVVCVEVRPGERESLSASVKLERNKHLAGLEYSLLARADDVRFYVEHDGGTLECPTLYQRQCCQLGEPFGALCRYIVRWSRYLRILSVQRYRSYLAIIHQFATLGSKPERDQHSFWSLVRSSRRPSNSPTLLTIEQKINKHAFASLTNC